MLPILLLSILTIYIIIERWTKLRSTTKVPKKWMEAIKIAIRRGDLEGVSMLCQKRRYAMARIIEVGIKSIKESIEDIERTVSHVGQAEIAKLENNLSLLGTIAGVSPMLGFLGTVIGMIQAFMAMAQTTHQISPQLISGGIYEAMITTAAGLVVGITANLSYNLFLVHIQQKAKHIEHTTNEFVNIIRGQMNSAKYRGSHEIQPSV